MNEFLIYQDAYVMLCAIWYHFVEFKKCEKRPWRSITLSKVAGLYVKEFYLNM